MVLKQNAKELWERLKKSEERSVLGDKTNLKSGGDSTPTRPMGGDEVISIVKN